jgi:hypothetical protein
MHYRRLRLYGDPLARQVVRGDDEGRFWSHVEKTPGCWLWSGALTHDGYGRFRMPDGHVMAHRFAYELLVGPIPEGLVLDHVRARGCVHRHCVRPDHLEPVTNEVNLLRGDTFVAENAAKSHCPAEHPYDEANTIRRNGRRICRTCEQARAGQPAGR